MAVWNGSWNSVSNSAIQTLLERQERHSLIELSHSAPSNGSRMVGMVLKWQCEQSVRGWKMKHNLHLQDKVCTPFWWCWCQYDSYTMMKAMHRNFSDMDVMLSSLTLSQMCPKLSMAFDLAAYGIESEPFLCMCLFACWLRFTRGQVKKTLILLQLGVGKPYSDSEESMSNRGLCEHLCRIEVAGYNKTSDHCNFEQRKVKTHCSEYHLVLKTKPDPCRAVALL